MKVTIRYTKNGKVAVMDKRYADVLIKMKRAEMFTEEKKTVSFKPTVNTSMKGKTETKPVTEKETVAKKWTPKPKAEEKIEEKVEEKAKPFTPKVFAKVETEDKEETTSSED